MAFAMKAGEPSMSFFSTLESVVPLAMFLVNGDLGPKLKCSLFTILGPDLKFVKKITRPNFRAKEFYTLKMRKSRLLSPAINSKNASLSVIWPSFG